MLDKHQSQSVCNGATAVMAGGNVSITNLTQIGPSVSELRVIAEEIWLQNHHKLSAMARETANLRAAEITNLVIQRLQQEFPDGFNKGNDPDFQHGLFIVQKEYARNGNRDIGDLLVNILVDRSKRNQRDMLQIVLNEALTTVPKLTDSNLASLAVAFFIKHAQIPIVRNSLEMGQHLDKYLLPFLPKLPTLDHRADFDHLVFAGCGTTGLANDKIHDIFETAYPDYFHKCFDPSDIPNYLIELQSMEQVFEPCVSHPSKLQLKEYFSLSSGFRDLLRKKRRSQEYLTEERLKYNFGPMRSSEIEETICRVRPYMEDFISQWSQSQMRGLVLTTVGMAIGHANIKRVVGDFPPLAIWFE